MVASSHVGAEGGSRRGRSKLRTANRKRPKSGRAWVEGRGQGVNYALSLGAQNQQGDHMSEPSAAPVAAPASMPMASGAPEL